MTLTGNIRPFSGAMSRAQGRLTAFQRRVNAVKNTIQRTFQRAAVFAVIGFTLALGKAVQVATKFEAAMTRIETLVGVATDRVAAFSSQVTQMAPDVAVGPNELADALFAVTSAGERGSRAMDILRSSAEAAAVGLGDTREIAKTVVAAMTAFGPGAVDAQEAVNTLVGTVREGNLVAEDLAGSLGRVIPIASSVGVTFQEVGAFIATFTRQGVSASEAVTSLRSILKAALRPTNQQKEALAELGMTVESFNQRVATDFIGLLRDLAGRFDTNREAVANLIGRVRGLAGFFGTAVTQGGELQQILASIEGTATKDVTPGFERVQKTGAFAFNRLKAAAGSLGEAVGDTLAPAVSGVADLFAGMASIIEAVTRDMSDLIPVSEEVADVLGRVVGLATTVGVTTALVAGSVSKIKDIIGPLAVLSAPVGGLTAALGGLAAVVAAGGALALGLEALQRTLRDVRSESEDTRTSMEELSNAIKDMSEDSLRAWIPRAERALATTESLKQALGRQTGTGAVGFDPDEFQKVLVPTEELEAALAGMNANIQRVEGASAVRARGFVLQKLFRRLVTRSQNLREQLGQARSALSEFGRDATETGEKAESAFGDMTDTIDEMIAPLGTAAGLTGDAAIEVQRLATEASLLEPTRPGPLTGERDVLVFDQPISQLLVDFNRQQIREGIRSVGRDLRNEAGRIERIMERAGTRAGESLIQGIILGADNMKAQLKRFLANLASTIIVGQLKSVLDIGSPSKVMVAAGMSIGEGLARGIERTTDRVEMAANRMTAAATPATPAFAAPTASVGSGRRVRPNRGRRVRRTSVGRSGIRRSGGTPVKTGGGSDGPAVQVLVGGVEIRTASLAEANAQIPKLRKRIRKEMLRAVESRAVRERIRRA